jgi:hypothetical protein
MDRYDPKKTWDCELCNQHVEIPGPWCVLYVEGRFCEPVSTYRKWIRTADSEGDGALVNALCYVLSMNTTDNFVP